LNTEVVVEVNFGGMVGDNSSWTRGTDPSRIFQLTEVFWDESDTLPEYLSDGRLITTIRTYKTARTYQNIVLTYISSSEAAIAESLAFNQTIGFAGVDPLSPAMLKYISFYRKQRDLYVGTKDVASVAVLHSYSSITYHNSGAGLSATLVEQALVQAKIPFHLIFDEHLSHLSPAIHKVLILPNSECLSDEQLASIRRYVEAGGGLIATEDTGLYDSWRRGRVNPGLQGLVDRQVPGIHGGNEMGAPRLAAPAPTRKTFGRGRVVYFPEIEFDGPLPPPQPYFPIGAEFWKRPENWKELVDAVHWAAQDDIPLRVLGPDFLGANLVEQPDKQRRLVHLVNYNTKNISSIENIEVRCAIPADKSASTVRLYTPDLDTYDTLTFRMQGSEAVFTVPKLNTYCMVAVSW
jgi:hypothetical protein